MKEMTAQIMLESLFVGLSYWLEEEMRTPLVTKGNKIAKLFEALITVSNLKI